MYSGGAPIFPRWPSARRVLARRPPQHRRRWQPGSCRAPRGRVSRRPRKCINCEGSRAAARPPPPASTWPMRLHRHRHQHQHHRHGPRGPRNPGSPCTKPHLPGPVVRPVPKPRASTRRRPRRPIVVPSSLFAPSAPDDTGMRRECTALALTEWAARAEIKFDGNLWFHVRNCALDSIARSFT